jgi:dihydroorotate dehydrogenase (NAD+) catalytic subunit
MAETASGMLNAVGLQNKGVEYFEKVIYPRINAFDTQILVNVSGSTVEDYVETAETHPGTTQYTRHRTQYILS